MDEPFVISFGEGVGPLRLGMNVYQTLDMLNDLYPRLNVEIVFPHPHDVMTENIHFVLVDWGIRLHFLPLSQTLVLIDIFDTSLLNYYINGTYVSEKSMPTTLEMLQKSLGPTFPGTFVEDTKYLLRLDGAGLLFCVPSKYQHIYSDGKHLPVTLPDGKSVPLQRIYVCPVDFDLLQPASFPDDNSTMTITTPSTPHVSVHMNATSSPSVSIADIGTIALGATPQDIISLLGDPSLASLVSNTNYSTRYEYKQHGFELYFTKRHRLYRIVLHNNLPGHRDFGVYTRCPFSLILPLESNKTKSNGVSGAESAKPEHSQKTITFSSKWKTVAGALQQLRDVAESTPAIKTPPAGSPFPATHLYGYPEVSNTSKRNIFI